MACWQECSGLYTGLAAHDCMLSKILRPHDFMCLRFQIMCRLLAPRGSSERVIFHVEIAFWGSQKPKLSSAWPNHGGPNRAVPLRGAPRTRGAHQHVENNMSGVEIKYDVVWCGTARRGCAARSVRARAARRVRYDALGRFWRCKRWN
eukprot:2102747-Prymnesium_polylepis.1